MPIKPERLRCGDMIGIVSPASPPPDPRAIDRGVGVLEELGFKVKLAPNAVKRHGFLAGSDRERAGDLMRMFADRAVKAILCVRGGHGATRLLPLLDYRLMRDHPKIFAGYSDITALNCALLARANLVTFHGPMLNMDFVGNGFPKFTREGFFRTLMLAEPGGVCRGYRAKTVSVLRGGVASGPLMGGNLSMLCVLVGTPWQPSFRRRILFFEDIGEPPYRYDRMLTHLLNAGLLQQLAGVAVGLNTDCLDRRAGRAGEYRQSLEDVLKDRLLPLKVPVVTGLPFGHTRNNATLPLGVEATLDGRSGDLLVASAVR